MLRRREFIGLGSLAAAGMAMPRLGLADEKKPLKFLFITDHHIESDFVQSHGITKGEPVYTMWKPGDHAAVIETYRFINRDPYCRDIDFALFGGDQLNTGYDHLPKDMADELKNYYRTLNELDVFRQTTGKTADMAFVAAPWKHRGKEVVPSAPNSRVVAIQGNHDVAVEDFYRDCAFTAGDTRFICFFASYVGLPPPPGAKFASTGKIGDATIAFIEREMKKVREEGKLKHIVLVSHWAIADKGKGFSCPIIGPCKENGMSANRDKLLALCEKYGCKLYINGHEHNGNYPVGKVGSLSDINCGTLTAEHGGGAFAIVEMHDDRAVFNVYSRAKVAKVEKVDGVEKVEGIEQPKLLFKRIITL